MTRRTFIKNVRDTRRMVAKGCLDSATSFRVLNTLFDIDRLPGADALAAVNKARAAMEDPTNRFGETSKAVLVKKLDRLAKNLETGGIEEV